MFKLLANISIRNKLTIVLMTATSVALTVAAVAWVLMDQHSFREWIFRNTQARARIIATHCETELTSNDPSSVEELLQEYLEVDPHLGAITVFDRQGRIFAQKARSGWQKTATLRIGVGGVLFGDNRLDVLIPVKTDNTRLGTVLVQSDLGELHQRRKHGLLTAVCVVLAATIVGFLAAIGLQRCVTRPIQKLTATVREVGTRNDFKLCAVKMGDDELGELVDGFNSMLAQLQARDEALAEARGELEARVIVRTSELHEANERLLCEVEAHKRARKESEALHADLATACRELQIEVERRSRVQEALLRSEARFSTAFRSSPVPQAIFTRRSRVLVDVNDRFAELVGADRDSIIGMTIFDIPVWSQPETRARLEQHLVDMLPLRHWECCIVDAGGKTRSSLLSTENLQLGNESCVLLMTEDISERVNLESQLRQAQKMEAIGQLASGVAHDFNNLLTIMQGYSQLMLAKLPADSDMRDPLEKITGATERAAKLTSQLLTFSRKRASQLKTVDLNQTVTNLTTMLRPLLGENVRLKWQPAAALPLIEGDPGMLEQVLVNLAVNARDAMPHGGELGVSTFACDIDASTSQRQTQAREGCFVCLQVSDSGCGMDDTTLEHIFEPFFTTKGIGKGTGLGLATVYGIVKQHRGWVEVSSRLDVGTKFKVFLPVAQVEAADAERKGDGDIIRGGNETILLVEDEYALRSLVTQILRGYGYHVIEAQHGKEALQVWRNLASSPNLLLTDLMMPEGISGWQLAEQLRQERPELKIIYTSGYSPELFNGQVKLRDRFNFIPKPFNPRTLAKAVRECLDNQAGATVSISKSDVNEKHLVAEALC